MPVDNSRAEFIHSLTGAMKGWFSTACAHRMFMNRKEKLADLGSSTGLIISLRKHLSS
jgi:hypothetical protein